MGAFTKLFGNTILENLAVGTTASTAKFTIKGNGSTSATTALLIQNSSNSTIFSVDDVGNSAVSGLLTLAQGNFLQPSGNTAVWFSDGNTPLRIVRTFALLNLDNNGGLTLGSSLNCSTVSVSLNADGGAGVYTGLFTTITNGINRNMNNANRQVLGLTSTGGGSVQNAPKLSFLEISRGTVTGYAAYVGIDVVDCEVRLNSTSGNTLIGSSPSNTAKLSIKGGGSTSATTSLLVQDSSNSTSLSILDDHSTSFILEQSATWEVRNAANNRFVRISGINKDLTSSGIITGQQSLVTGSLNLSGTTIAGFNGSALILGGDSVVLNSRPGAGSNLNNTLRILSGQAEPSFRNGVVYISHYGNLSTVANHSAQLQVDSTTAGFLPPRMTSAQKIAIVSPAEGLMVYDTDLKRPCFHDGTNWITL